MLTDFFPNPNRIVFDSPELAGILWERIKPWVPVISINGNPHEKHINGVRDLMQGTWQPLGLNNVGHYYMILFLIFMGVCICVRERELWVQNIVLHVYTRTVSTVCLHICSHLMNTSK